MITYFELREFKQEEWLSLQREAWRIIFDLMKYMSGTFRALRGNVVNKIYVHTSLA